MDSYNTGDGFTGDTSLNHWQGVAFAAREQVTGTQALAGRYEYFNDPTGSQTGMRQDVQEFTLTYEYKWAEGLESRVEYRRDWSDEPYFPQGRRRIWSTRNPQ